MTFVFILLAFVIKIAFGAGNFFAGVNLAGFDVNLVVINFFFGAAG